ncbi:electron transport complex subunit RsxB [Magnetofaba australis]|uniref:Ion-translocating oxidoreductase complex subunit B n=1 Tax=Magnetofaba australis IT-1 TaxID=1434232 RepID=A0A1Y2K2J5_9PROT|nr:electron transport complex subunit RsxB [Magnetofaba australis]OSM01877.1 putative RnfABCDGE type electron transport complex subunit beta [Magnetofaba australis IT-1]
MIEAILSMGGMALVAGLGLGYAAKKFHVEGDPMVDKIEAALPATNCGNCGYPGCRPYAEALANGEAEINLCTPGGKDLMEDLAAMLGVEPAAMEDSGPTVAFIRETDCIGCTACIKACPVDAIVGANKQSHTVITAECTSCEKCIEPCPVDCIDMIPVKETLYDWQWNKPAGPAAPTVH